MSSQGIKLEKCTEITLFKSDKTLSCNLTLKFPTITQNLQYLLLLGYLTINILHMYNTGKFVITFKGVQDVALWLFKK